AVADPDSERSRTEPLSDFDALQIVRNSLFANRLVGMGQAAELVGQLTRKVFERIRIDGVENDPIGARKVPQFAEIVNPVPGKMWRHRGRRTSQLLDHGAVLELLEDVARLAGHRKAREPRAARADPPAGNR